MSQDTEQPSTEIEVAAIARPASTAIMTAEQFDSTWRMSKALAQSGSFKDIGRGPNMPPEVLHVEASKALARVLLGADFGMSPTQALMGIDIVKGNPQIRGVALGRMVRNSARRPLPTGESYDYAILDRGFTPGDEFAVVALYRRDEDGQWPRVEDEEGETFPTILGPITIAKGKRLPEGVEAFRVAQADKRKLIREDGAWATQPEVMCVWRALSQLVRFHAPDAIGGMSVYTEADSLRGSEAESLGEGAPAEAPVELPELAEAVVARGQAVGHSEFGSREWMAMHVGGQPPERVAEMCARAMEAMADLPEIAEADVVERAERPCPWALRAGTHVIGCSGQADHEGDHGATHEGMAAQWPSSNPDAFERTPVPPAGPERTELVERMVADADALLDEARSLPEDDPDREPKLAEAQRINEEATAIADGVKVWL